MSEKLLTTVVRDRAVRKCVADWSMWHHLTKANSFSELPE